MSDRYDVLGKLFYDRWEAGHALAPLLHRFEREHPVVLGLPRGGVPIAAAIAEDLGAELDVVVARKLGAPGSAELAIGAVTANGGQYFNDEIIQQLGVRPDYLAREVARQSEEAERQEHLFRGPHHHIELEGRVVILADDGLATGATMRAAARSARRRSPSRLIVAVPVGSVEACEALREDADEVVCPHQPEPFWAVGSYYRNFEPVPDEEVTSILASYRRRAITGPESPATRL
jgi:predicted phosphoribosyltransferase